MEDDRQCIPLQHVLTGAFGPLLPRTDARSEGAVEVVPKAGGGAAKARCGEEKATTFGFFTEVVVVVIISSIVSKCINCPSISLGLFRAEDDANKFVSF